MNPPEKCPETTRLELSPRKQGWITPELIKETLTTWQPYYNGDMTEADAREILATFGRLLDVV